MKQSRITIKQINEKIDKNLEVYVKKCENKYKNQIYEAVQNIIKNKKIKFVLLAGPSSSGKTTTSKILSTEINKNGYNAMPMSLDDFFVERNETPLWEDGTYNYETSESIDWKLFSKCMQGLLEGKTMDLPTYNFTTGKKEFGKMTKLEDNTIVIIEGLHALNPIIDQFIPKEKCYKIYLSVNTEVYFENSQKLKHYQVRLFRRIIRDLHTRSTSVEDTLKIWEKVRKGELLYISPFIDTAEYLIDSFHPYELGVYKSILEHLNSTEKSLDEVVKMLCETKSLPQNIVPKDSVLQEFIPKQK